MMQVRQEIFGSYHLGVKSVNSRYQMK